MIISHQRNYIFVHIPKTGGTSLALALEAKAAKDDILIGDTPKALKRRGRVKKLTSAGRLWKHSKLADIEGIVSPEEMSDFLVFTITRNPWDRFVSYYHWLREQSFDHPFVELAKQVEFAAFLQHPANLKALESDQVVDYLSDAEGRYCGDMVLRLESLQQDAEALEAKLGFKLGILPHENASKRPRDYRSFYSDQTAEIIAKAYRDDIARFNYQF